jgi:hypothetical protein
MPAAMRGSVYDFGGDCPKCKGLNPMRVHCRGQACKMAPADAGEHLDSMCLQCGYAWPARCADAQPMDRRTTKRRKGGQPT